MKNEHVTRPRRCYMSRFHAHDVWLPPIRSWLSWFHMPLIWGAFSCHSKQELTRLNATECFPTGENRPPISKVSARGKVCSCEWFVALTPHASSHLIRVVCPRGCHMVMISFCVALPWFHFWGDFFHRRYICFRFCHECRAMYGNCPYYIMVNVPDMPTHVDQLTMLSVISGN